MSSKAESARIQAEIAARLGQSIKRAEQALISRKSQALRPFDLTVPQYAALMVLSYSPGLSGAQLARACMVTPQTMATVLGNLKSKGLIRRDPSSVHKKVLVTELTRTGRAVLSEADAAARAVEDRLSAEFDREDQEQLRSLLERAIKVLSSDG
ncbi:MarR family winged helix-turn-helix transcriptional regulator [Cellulomonas sp. NPDC055163]